MRTWLGEDHPKVDEVIERRIERYRELAADGSTIPEEVREAVRYAAGRVPLAVVSGAARPEIEPVLEAAELADLVRVVVAAEDVPQGKPAPDGYLRALELLDGDLAASEVLVLEDAEAGIAAAQSAGMPCIAVLGTLPPERLAAADEIVPALDVCLMQRVLG